MAGLTAVFESVVTRDAVADHPGREVPGQWVATDTALVDLSLAVANAIQGGGRIQDLTIDRPLALPDGGARRLQAVLSAPTEDGVPLTVYGRADTAGAGEPWTGHADGLVVADGPSGDPWDAWGSVWERRGAAFPVGDLSSMPPGTAGLWRGDREAWCRLEVTPDIAGARHLLLRAALSTVLAAAGEQENPAAWRVLAVGELAIDAPQAGTLWLHAAIGSPTDAASPAGDVRIVDDGGIIRGELLGLRLSPIHGGGAEWAGRQDDWSARLPELPSGERREYVKAAVRADVATVLELTEPTALPADRALLDLGMDSLMAVSLRHELARRTGIDLPATLAFEYPTIREISEYLLDILGGAASVEVGESEGEDR